MVFTGKTAIVSNSSYYGNSLYNGKSTVVYRKRTCDSNLTSNNPANQYQKLKLIQNTVRVPSSIYTMNLGALNVYQKPTSGLQPIYNDGSIYVTGGGANWNQMSDRKSPHTQVAVTASGSTYHGSSTKRTITRARPGAGCPGGIGVDIKHNSYDRYLNRLKGKGPLRRGVIPPTYGRPIIYNPALPIRGGKTIKTNILGTLNMLGLAKRTRARILLTSTSEVYGDPLISPQTEEYWGNVNPIGIRSCYDEGKRLAETLMMEYHRNCGVDTRIARIFNTYGPRLNRNDGRVISNFIVQALENQPITIYGDGSQTRSFCYVSDQVDGLIKLMNCEKGYHLPINIGNPIEKSMLEIASIILRLTGSSSPVVHEPLPQDDPMQRRPEITKARTILGWEPQVGLEEGLLKTIEYFKQ